MSHEHSPTFIPPSLKFRAPSEPARVETRPEAKPTPLLAIHDEYRKKTLHQRFKESRARLDNLIAKDADYRKKQQQRRFASTPAAAAADAENKKAMKVSQGCIRRAAAQMGMSGSLGIILVASEILRRSGRGPFCPSKVAAHAIIADFARAQKASIPPQEEPPKSAPSSPHKSRTKYKSKKFKDRAVNADTATERTGFYWSEEWRRMRYVALRAARGVCELCGAAPMPGKPLHVDHIKPRSKYPELELDASNLQVLCADCNLGKGNIDEIDWRRPA